MITELPVFLKSDKRCSTISNDWVSKLFGVCSAIMFSKR